MAEVVEIPQTKALRELVRSVLPDSLVRSTILQSFNTIDELSALSVAASEQLADLNRDMVAFQETLELLKKTSPAANLVDEVINLKLRVQAYAKEVRELASERDQWKRRAAAHGCDTEKGDPDCG